MSTSMLVASTPPLSDSERHLQSCAHLTIGVACTRGVCLLDGAVDSCAPKPTPASLSPHHALAASRGHVDVVTSIASHGRCVSIS